MRCVVDANFQMAKGKRALQTTLTVLCPIALKIADCNCLSSRSLNMSFTIFELMSRLSEDKKGMPQLQEIFE